MEKQLEVIKRIANMEQTSPEVIREVEQGLESRLSNMLSQSMHSDASFLESLWVYTAGLLRTFGVPMFIGSIPWAILGGWFSYRLAHRYSAAQQARRRKKREIRLQRRNKPSSTAL
mgnify:CR=1 FL=1